LQSSYNGGSIKVGSIYSYVTNVVIDSNYAMPYAYPRQDKLIMAS